MSNAANHIDAIDAAIAKAKSRAAERTKSSVTPEEREASRQAAKAERERIRAEKKANRPETKPAHMKKVANAAAKLPGLGTVAQGTFDEVIRTLNTEQITALALHLQHHNRVQATTKATSGIELKVGQVVRITGGDPKYIGMTGAIETLRRIRCYVAVPGAKRPVYIFTSECTPIEGGEELPETEPMAETGTGF